MSEKTLNLHCYEKPLSFLRRYRHSFVCACRFGLDKKHQSKSFLLADDGLRICLPSAPFRHQAYRIKKDSEEKILDGFHSFLELAV